MPHAIEMKDGKLLTPFGIRDLLEAVSDYAGEELAREIEEYIDTNVADIDDYEKEFDRLEQENERLADHSVDFQQRGQSMGTLQPSARKGPAGSHAQGHAG